MALNHSSSSSSSKASNDPIATTTPSPQRSQAEKPEKPKAVAKFALECAPRCIYIGRTLRCHYGGVIFTSDCILFNNIGIGISREKCNITVPYIEMKSIRYCFNSEIGLFAIQPIYQSYQKLRHWTQGSSVTAVPSRVPENFIMLHFMIHPCADSIETISRHAREKNAAIKIYQITSAAALNYLRTPNKPNLVKYLHATSSIGILEAERRELEDDDDEDEVKECPYHFETVNKRNFCISLQPKTMHHSDDTVAATGMCMISKQQSHHSNSNE